jgi:hypothetical protein
LLNLASNECTGVAADPEVGAGVGLLIGVTRSLTIRREPLDEYEERAGKETKNND